MKIGFKLRRLLVKIENLVRKTILILDYFVWLIISGDKFDRRPKNVEKILVIDNSALGDTLNTYCIMKKAEEKYKNIDFYYFTSPKFAEMVKQSKVVSHESWEKIKDLNFDIVILIAGHPLIFSKLFYGISNFVVGGMASGIRSSFLNNLFISRRSFPKYLNKIEERFKIFELAGFEFEDYHLGLPYFERYSKEAKELIKELKIKENDKIIFFNPSAATSTKARKKGLFPSHDWNKFHKLANLLKDYKILITGIKEEEFLIEKIIKKTRHKNIYSICDKTSFLGLGELFRLLKDRGILVSLDTGTVPLGVVAGIKVVDLMGSYPKELYYAWNNNITLYPNSGCSGCRKYYCPEEDSVCMKNINEKEVYSIIKK